MDKKVYAPKKSRSWVFLAVFSLLTLLLGAYSAHLHLAAVATLLSALFWGGLIYWLSGRRARYLALALTTLLFSALVNVWVKIPLHELFASSLSIPRELSKAPHWFLPLFLFIAPVTEEAVKLSPLMAGRVRRAADRSSALWVGMGLGMGFGIGEIWYMAWRLSALQWLADYPLHYFGGFISERTVCVFTHGVLTAVVVTGLARGLRGLLAGYAWAVLLHAFVNVGPVMYRAGLWGPTAALLYFVFSVAVVAAVFEYLRRRATGREASK